MQDSAAGKLRRSLRPHLPQLLCTPQLCCPNHIGKAPVRSVLNVLPEDPELQLNLARQIIHHSLTNKVRQSQGGWHDAAAAAVELPLSCSPAHEEVLHVMEFVAAM